MAFDFSGKKVLVTGAGRGIGRGIALALAKADCKVYALDINAENLDKLANEYSNIVTIVQDLTNWEELRSKLEELEPLDGLVNNAGAVFSNDKALEMSKQDIDAHLSLNLYAVINCCQTVATKMVSAGKKGSIVNMASLGSQQCMVGFLGYSLSKAGVDMVTKQMALELGPHNIRVNSVNPTVTDTGIIDPEVRDHVLQIATERMAIARVIQIEEIVGPVLYLLSDYSAMVTGTTHLVDGGTFANITTKK